MGGDVQTISTINKSVKQSKAIINVSDHLVNSQEKLHEIFARIESIQVPSCFDITWNTSPGNTAKYSWPECVGSCVKCILSLKHLSQADRVRYILLCLHLLPFCLEQKFGVNRETGSCVALISLKVFGKTFEESSEEEQQKIENFVIKVGCHRSASAIRSLFTQVELALLQSLADLDVNASLLHPIINQFKHLEVRVAGSGSPSEAHDKEIEILATILEKSISSVICIYECEDFARTFLSYHNKLEFNSQLIVIILREIVRHLGQQPSRQADKSPVVEVIQSQKSFKKIQAMIHQVLHSKQMSGYLL